jgi:hypothetical protein
VPTQAKGMLTLSSTLSMHILLVDTLPAYASQAKGMLTLSSTLSMHILLIYKLPFLLMLPSYTSRF